MKKPKKWYNARIRVQRKHPRQVTTETFIVLQRTPKLAVREARLLFNLDKELWGERLLAIWPVVVEDDEAWRLAKK